MCDRPVDSVVSSDLEGQREQCAPDCYAHDEEVPEQVEELQKQNRQEDLVSHPPSEPNAVLGVPSFGGFTIDPLDR